MKSPRLRAADRLSAFVAAVVFAYVVLLMVDAIVRIAHAAF